MSEDLNMALGMAFGSLVTAIRRNGISEDELRRWLDNALGTYAAMTVVISDRPA